MGPRARTPTVARRSRRAISLALVAALVAPISLSRSVADAPPAAAAPCGSHFCEAAVLEASSPTYGLSWGDADNDRFPDLFVGNHDADPRWFRNQRDGTFAGNDPTAGMDDRDTHGVAWGDLTDTGFQDVVEVSGWASGQNPGPVHYYRNAASRGGPLYLTSLPQDPKPARSASHPHPGEESPDYYDEETDASGTVTYKEGGRGRTPLLLDWNADGRLDLLETTERADSPSRPDLVGRFPSTVFVQGTDGRLRPASDLPAGFPAGRIAPYNTSEYGQLTWMAPQAGATPVPVLVLHDNNSPGSGYRLRRTPGDAPPGDGRAGVGFPTTFQDDTGTRPIGSVRDTAIGDFDGDGVTDLVLLANKALQRSGARLSNDGSRVAVAFRTAAPVDNPIPFGWPSVPAVRFSGPSARPGAPLQLELDRDWSPRIFLGSAKTPIDFGTTAPGVRLARGSLTLDPTAASSPAGGWPSPSSTDPAGVYVGFDNGRWQLAYRSPGNDILTVASFAGGGTASDLSTNVDHLAAPDNASPEGQLPPVVVTDVSPADRVFSGYQAEALPLTETPVDGWHSCTSVTAFDVDNDGDLDLFFVCAGPASRRSAELYLNQLKETGQFGFVRAGRDRPMGAEGRADAAGSSGPSDPRPVGYADTVVSADYDLDGRVDLAVADGGDAPPFNRGPVTLFRNDVQNTNHWLEVDLRGTASNAQGLGARVEVKTADGTQVRDVSGMHRAAQDLARVHVGLGSSSAAEVTVSWPNGQRQAVGKVAADQLLTVTQTQPSTNPTFFGPAIDACRDHGVHLWRDLGTTRWHVRASAGGTNSSTCTSGPAATYTGTIVSNVPITVSEAASAPLEYTAAAPYTDQLSPRPAPGRTASANTVTFTASTAGSSLDGFDLDIPAGARVLVSAREVVPGDTRGRLIPPNPRTLRLGTGKVPATPSGWIVDPGTLPASSAVPADSARRAGLSLSLDGSGLHARVYGNAGYGQSFPWTMSLVLPSGSQPAVGDSLETGETLTTGTNVADARGWCAGTWNGTPSMDGVGVPALGGGPIGVAFSYQQLTDGWWPTQAQLGPANATVLPTG